MNTFFRPKISATLQNIIWNIETDRCGVTPTLGFQSQLSKYLSVTIEHDDTRALSDVAMDCH